MKINTNNASLKMSAGEIRQFPRDARPQVVFSGRSNVGKSSLLNTLLNRRSLARVSSAPGKTITVNFYDVDEKIYLVDLPGYGYAKRSADEQKRWSALTDGYFTQNPNADLISLVVQLVDIRVGPTKDDLAMLKWLEDSGLPHCVVLTKTDKLSANAAKAAIADLSLKYFSPAGITPIPFSSVTREGVNTLWSTIFRAVEQ